MAKGYSEPTNYFSKETLKKYKLGEYAEEEKENKKKGERTLQDAFNEYEKKSKK